MPHLCAPPGSSISNIVVLRIAEPLFSTEITSAAIELVPAMHRDDLKKALGAAFQVA